MPQGVVKWFSPNSGYGFIVSDTYPDTDIMVHFNDIVMEGYRKLIKDQTVNFKLRNTEKGPRAYDVEPITTRIKNE